MIIYIWPIWSKFNKWISKIINISYSKYNNPLTNSFILSKKGEKYEIECKDKKNPDDGLQVYEINKEDKKNELYNPALVFNNEEPSTVESADNGQLFVRGRSKLATTKVDSKLNMEILKRIDKTKNSYINDPNYLHNQIGRYGNNPEEKKKAASRHSIIESSNLVQINNVPVEGPKPSKKSSTKDARGETKHPTKKSSTKDAKANKSATEVPKNKK